MKHQQPLIRRTFSQERFEILIKRQQSGKATFLELTELDEIVNRDPDIRYSILEEMEGKDTPTDGPPKPEEIIPIQQVQPPGLVERLRSFIHNFFNFAAADISLSV